MTNPTAPTTAPERDALIRTMLKFDGVMVRLEAIGDESPDRSAFQQVADMLRADAEEIAALEREIQILRRHTRTCDQQVADFEISGVDPRDGAPDA